MFADKSTMLAQINSVIENKSFTEKQKPLDFLTVHKSGTKNASPKPVHHSNNRDLLNKLQQRIADLEANGDHLLYFIHFLFENFTELVKNILAEDAIHQSCEPEASNDACEQQKKPRAAARKEKISLTKREMDVFNLLIKGLCAKEIANRLFISETTVVTHKKHLKEKFNAKNTAEFISKAFRTDETDFSADDAEAKMSS